MKTTFQSGAAQGRLASLDALRGFDMLMISGGGAFLSVMGGKTNIAFIDAVAAQFHHPDWNGFTFYDFIFPLFLFMAWPALRCLLACEAAWPKVFLKQIWLKRCLSGC